MIKKSSRPYIDEIPKVKPALDVDLLRSISISHTQTNSQQCSCNASPVCPHHHWYTRFDHICLGTWLAECALAHPEGAFIRQARQTGTTTLMPRFELVW